MKLDPDRIRQAASKRDVKGSSVEKAPKKKKRKTVDVTDVFQLADVSADSDNVVLTSIFADRPRTSRMSHPPRRCHPSQPVREDPSMVPVAQSEVPLAARVEKGKKPQMVDKESEQAGPYHVERDFTLF